MMKFFNATSTPTEKPTAGKTVVTDRSRSGKKPSKAERWDPCIKILENRLAEAVRDTIGTLSDTVPDTHSDVNNSAPRWTVACRRGGVNPDARRGRTPGSAPVEMVACQPDADEASTELGGTRDTEQVVNHVALHLLKLRSSKKEMDDLASVRAKAMKAHDDANVEPSKSEALSWSAEKWCSSAHVAGEVGKLVARALLGKRGEDATLLNELRFLVELGKLESGKAALRYQLTAQMLSADWLDSMVDVLWSQVQQLEAASPEPNSKGSNAKFLLEKEAVTLAYGEVSTFFEGLEAFLGTPASSVMEGMKYEHCDSADSNSTFSPLNYVMETTSTSEWLFVTNPKKRPNERDVLNSPSDSAQQSAHACLGP